MMWPARAIAEYYLDFCVYEEKIFIEKIKRLLLVVKLHTLFSKTWRKICFYLYGLRER